MPTCRRTRCRFPPSWLGVPWPEVLVRGAFLALAAVGVAGCSDDGGTGPDPADGPASVNDYVADLGSWSDYSPLLPASEAAVGSDVETEETVEELIDGALHTVTYACTETPISLTDTPREIVMYEPNASIMWVGNLIQGDSYAGGQGTFEELSIRQRDTLKLSIDLLTGDNYAVVPDPTLTTVQSAIGELIQAATDAGHRSGSSIDYEETLTHATEEAALKLGLSAKYMGVSAKADLSTSRAANERTMTAHFVQKMFTISIELPQSPADLFSDALTQALWQAQVDAGNIGPTNLPVYIAQITYGRTLTYTLTSTHSEQRMRAAISASYNGFGASVSGYTEAELRETLSQQNIRVTAIGGEGQNVLDLISSGDLKSYFTTDAPLTSAKPLSYQLNYLGDNTVAKVSETTEYTRRVCAAQPATGGRFEFLPLQESAPPVASPYAPLAGDFDGDGREDLVWVHTVSGTAQAAVGFGQPDATLDIRAAWTHPATPVEGWGNGYRAAVGDFDGDGLDDLVWNRRQNNEPVNAIYVALSNGDGTFAAQGRLEHPRTGWADAWALHVADVDGDGRDDLVWTLGKAAGHELYIARAWQGGTFTFEPLQSTSAGGWTDYSTRIGDVNGDGRDDIIWNSVPLGTDVLSGVQNRTYVSRSDGDGTVTLLAYQDFPAPSSWTDHAVHVGDFDRDGRADLLWTATDRAVIPVYRVLGRTDGRFDAPGTAPGYQEVPHPVDNTLMQTLIGDFNGDGGDDLLWNRRDVALNHLYVGLSAVDGWFEFTPVDQEHPASQGGEDWTAFAGGVLVLDINGDGIDDIVWNERAATNRIYVARAKPAGVGSE